MLVENSTYASACAFLAFKRGNKSLLISATYVLFAPTLVSNSSIPSIPSLNPTRRSPSIFFAISLFSSKNFTYRDS